MSVVLAFDSATAATVAGLATPAGVIERRDDPPAGARPNHASRLLALCEELLAEAGAGWGDVTRIGVGVGPGTFTGLRIGVATARALAQATTADVVPVSTLQALALGARERDANGHALLAVLDARRSEVFTAGWSPAMRPLIAATAVAPVALAALLEPHPVAWLAVGEGASRYREQLEVAGASVPPDDCGRHRVSGAVLARLTLAGKPAQAATLVPDYLRLPDAEIARRRKLASA